MFMPMDSEKNWASGGTTEQTRNANERTNGSPSERTSKRANGWPNDRVNEQTVHRALAGKNERTKHRVNEPAKRDEQLNDRVDSSLFIVIGVYMDRFPDILMQT